jgi:hypothetical protein
MAQFLTEDYTNTDVFCVFTIDLAPSPLPSPLGGEGGVRGGMDQDVTKSNASLLVITEKCSFGSLNKISDPF